MNCAFCGHPTDKANHCCDTCQPNVSLIERHAADWWTIREAAKLLLREARCLRESHTVCNHWDDDDHSARKAYKELVHSALNLRRIRL